MFIKPQKTDWRLWALLGITLLALFYNIISDYAIRGNELKHIVQAIQKIERRIERIEDFLWEDK